MWILIWLQPLVAVAGVGLAGVAAFRRPWPRTGAAIQAVAVGASTLALGLYVASEDEYRGNGISRWEAYDAEGLTVAALAVGAASAAGLIAAAARDEPRLGAATLLASGVAAALAFLAFLANSLN